MTRKSIKISEASELVGLDKQIKNFCFFIWLRKLIIQKYRLSIPDLMRGKKYNMVEARMIIFYLLKKHTSYNYRDVAVLFDIKNHSLIHRSVKRIEGFILANRKRNILSVISYFEASKYALT
ncbi:MAG TPA: helix-turn-helix domain-containing protein [Cytophagaceae bacterium]|jgi:chromosomal replication initiation ATPase DnaA